jgi:putative peptidoglycan lipid II flippase
VNTLLLLYFAARRFGGINGRRIGRSLVRALASSAVMALVAWYLSRALVPLLASVALRSVVQVTVAGGLSLLAFYASAILLRSEETRELRGLLRRR